MPSGPFMAVARLRPLPGRITRGEHADHTTTCRILRVSLNFSKSRIPSCILLNSQLRPYGLQLVLVRAGGVVVHLKNGSARRSGYSIMLVVRPVHISLDRDPPEKS